MAKKINRSYPPCTDTMSMEDIGNLPPYSQGYYEEVFGMEDKDGVETKGKPPTKVFVYGSLLKGFGNNVLLRSSKCVGSFVTKDKYVMKSFGGFPALYKRDEISPNVLLSPIDRVRLRSLYRPVLGEVYEVNDTVLRHLDDLEGNGSFYLREKVDIVGYDEPCWVYICLSRHNSMPLVSLNLERNYSWKFYRQKQAHESLTSKEYNAKRRPTTEEDS